MSVIFLDIDGVLNSSKTANPRDLQRSFSFRIGATTPPAVQRPLLGIPYADVVPDLPRRSRWDEIRAWLKKHSDVNRYAVIDDDDDQLADLPAKPSRFLTHTY